MGLDHVEMVMEIEDEFRIHIPDDRAQQLTTVGQLINYVCGHQRRVVEAACPTNHTFYRVRHCLVSAAGVRRRDVHLRRRTADLISASSRRRVWRALHAEGLRLPCLRLPRPLSAVLLGLGGVTLLLSIGLLVVFPHANSLILIAGLWLLGPGLAWLVLRPAAVRVPPACFTIGGLVRAASPPAVLTNLDRAEIEAKVRQIVSSTLGVAPERVTPGARFVEDLGAD